MRQEPIDAHLALAKRKPIITHLAYQKKEAWKRGFLVGMIVTALIASAFLLTAIAVIIELSN